MPCSRRTPAPPRSPDADPGLHDTWEDEDRRRLVSQRTSAGRVAVERSQRAVHRLVDALDTGGVCAGHERDVQRGRGHERGASMHRADDRTIPPAHACRTPHPPAQVSFENASAAPSRAPLPRPPLREGDRHAEPDGRLRSHGGIASIRHPLAADEQVDRRQPFADDHPADPEAERQGDRGVLAPVERPARIPRLDVQPAPDVAEQDRLDRQDADARTVGDV